LGAAGAFVFCKAAEITARPVITANTKIDLVKSFTGPPNLRLCAFASLRCCAEVAKSQRRKGAKAQRTQRRKDAKTQRRKDAKDCIKSCLILNATRSIRL